jgi:hypothetical protein
MARKTLTIRPEFSALGRRKPISPLLPKLIQCVLELRRLTGLNAPRLALELGCGQLRNLKALKRYFASVILVDTSLQLNRPHDFGGKRLTIPEYVRRHYPEGSVTVMSDREFAISNLRPDVIFSINVMDVVPPRARRVMLSSVCGHLPITGQFASLVPRNDSRTLHLCRGTREYRDGHLFPNHGAFTFYKNWSEDELQRLYRSYSLGVVSDRSCYRHSCLLCMVKTSLKRPRLKQPSRASRFRLRERIRPRHRDTLSGGGPAKLCSNRKIAGVPLDSVVVVSYVCLTT